MLKTITKSSNKKIGQIAATYRAGSESVYGTCPSTCVLKPEGQTGSLSIDREYLEALKTAVPAGGVSWTYTHFGARAEFYTEPGQTCINISQDTVFDATMSFVANYPTVVVRPASESAKVDVINGIRFVRCPAEYGDVTCQTCGGRTPLCARHDRNYVIKFTAHGAQKKKIEIRDANQTERGGCYGNGGPVRLQWEKTKGSCENDAETLRTFVAGLPEGTMIRHHVVGDVGVSV